MMKDKKIQILDVSGHKCPVPVLRLRRKLVNLAVGDQIEVRASDPMTQIDIPHFCAQAGHVVVEASKQEELYIFRVRKDAGKSD